MKKIKVSRKDIFAIVDDDMYEQLSKYRWYVCRGYASRRVFNEKTNRYTRIFMHRLVMNTPKGFFTDHINMDRLDNRKENLRICTKQQNAFNREKGVNNTTGYKGVFKRPYSYIACVQFGNKKHTKYGFKTAKAAAIYYNEKAKELYGEFARLNEIT